MRGEKRRGEECSASLAFIWDPGAHWHRCSDRDNSAPNMSNEHSGGVCAGTQHTHTHMLRTQHTCVVFILLSFWCGAAESHCRSLQVHPELKQAVFTETENQSDYKATIISKTFMKTLVTTSFCKVVLHSSFFQCK